MAKLLEVLLLFLHIQESVATDNFRSDVYMYYWCRAALMCSFRHVDMSTLVRVCDCNWSPRFPVGDRIRDNFKLKIDRSVKTP